MTTGLTCTVNTCINHCDGYCSLHSINVGGHQAMMKDETFCRSFAQRPEGTQNSTNFCAANPHMSIKCSVEGCAYYKNGRCKAENVIVSGGSADAMQDTLCDTFTMR